MGKTARMKQHEEFQRETQFEEIKVKTEKLNFYSKFLILFSITIALINTLLSPPTEVIFGLLSILLITIFSVMIYANKLEREVRKEVLKLTNGGKKV